MPRGLLRLQLSYLALVAPLTAAQSKHYLSFALVVASLTSWDVGSYLGRTRPDDTHSCVDARYIPAGDKPLHSAHKGY